MIQSDPAGDPVRFRDDSGYADAVTLDLADPLAAFRERFATPDPDVIYLDGNSLGRAPARAPNRMEKVVRDQWADRLIRFWDEGWWDLQLRLGDLLAPVIGAGPGEVMISDSTSINLFKLAFAAVQSRPGRRYIVTDDLNFPTDLYVLESVARLFDGVEVVVVESDGIHGPVDHLAAHIGEETALVALSHTVFKSGYTYDIQEMTT